MKIRKSPARRKSSQLHVVNFQPRSSHPIIDVVPAKITIYQVTDQDLDQFASGPPESLDIALGIALLTSVSVACLLALLTGTFASATVERLIFGAMVASILAGVSLLTRGFRKRVCTRRLINKIREGGRQDSSATATRSTQHAADRF